MEFLTILLSGLLAFISPLGSILDGTAEKVIRSQIEEAETLEVRIDNVPSYQILRGKLQKVRIASRGLKIRENLKINTLEIVTDPLNLDLAILRQRENKNLRSSLREPLQAGVRLILAETDINHTLQSAAVKENLEKIINRLMNRQGTSSRRRYELLNPRIELLDNNRLSLQVELRRLVANGEEVRSLDIMLESGFKIIGGNRLELVKVVGSINNKPLSSQLLGRIAEGVNQRLDLKILEKNGIIARVLQLKIENRQLNLAAFVRLENLASEEYES